MFAAVEGMNASNQTAPSAALEVGRAADVKISSQDIAVGVILSAVDLVTFLGNVVVFICPAVEKRLRTVTYMFILSLATADLLVACLVMPFSIIYEVTGMWIFGRLFCKVWISFDVMFCTASIVTLCFISLDRYCSVATPYNYPKRMTRKSHEQERSLGRTPRTLERRKKGGTMLHPLPQRLNMGGWSAQSLMKEIEVDKLQQKEKYEKNAETSDEDHTLPFFSP